MNRQRGVIADLILYGVIAVAAIGVLAGINAGLKSHYLGPATAKWEQEKARLVASNDSCVAANTSLQATHDAFVAAKNKEVDDARKEYETLKAKRAANDKAKAPQLAQIAADREGLVTSLNKPDGGVSCDQLDSMLLDVAKQRARDFGFADWTPPNAGGIKIQSPRDKPVNPLARPK